MDPNAPVPGQPMQPPMMPPMPPQPQQPPMGQMPYMQQPVIPGQPMPMPAPMQPQPLAKKRFPHWLIIIIAAVVAIVAIVAAVLIIVLSATSAARSVSDKFMKDMQADDAQAAYSLASSDFKGATSESDLATLFEQVSPAMQGDFRQTQVKMSSESSSATTQVIYEVTTSHGKEYARVTLAKVSGEWQVLNFKVSDSPLDPTI